MSDFDDEIAKDFFIEASEIAEDLAKQLLDLENNAEDLDLLNAIFRGFHTIKGGAGFLNLKELVDVCHVAENVFEVLRTGKRTVTRDLMDSVLESLDVVNVNLEALQNDTGFVPASQDLLKSLEEYSIPDDGSSIQVEDEFLDVIGSMHGINKHELKQIENLDLENLSLQSSNIDLSSEAAIDDLLAMELKKNRVSGIMSSNENNEFNKKEKSINYKPKQSEQLKNEDLDDILNSELLKYGHEHANSSKKSSLGMADSLDKEGVTSGTSIDSSVSVESGSSDENDYSHKPNISDLEFEELVSEYQKSKFSELNASILDKASSVTESSSENSVKKSSIVSGKAVDTTDSSSKSKKAPVTKSSNLNISEKKLAQFTGHVETTVRVDTARLDEIMNMVGELVLVRNRLVTLGAKSSDEIMSKAVANLDVVTADLQMAVMKTRMQPIKKVFGRFPRLVRDLARSLQKDIVLNMEGEETDLDKNLVESLADPLVHLVRNAVDHGIEDPHIRLEKKKPRTGTILLAARQEGDHIMLNIKDDGSGMDPNVLRKKAVEKGLMDEDAATRLSDKECYELIFMPGFSTKQEISDISGRGVGMDVVKTKISQLNGILDIDSEINVGTKISIKVPLTLAILPTLMVVIGKQIFALPLTGVSEIFNLDKEKTNIVDGQLVVVVRNKALPLFYLVNWLTPTYTLTENDPQHVVLVTMGNQKIGFVVNGLLGQEEVVIKPLGEMLQGTAGMAGATITGDGNIAMILDVPGLLNDYVQKQK